MLCSAKANIASAAIPECYTIHMGDTPGLRRSLTAPTPSGHRASKEGRRREGTFATLAMSISCAPHQGSAYAVRSCHQVGAPLQRKQRRTCQWPKRGLADNATRSCGLGSLNWICQTDAGCPAESWETHRTLAGPSAGITFRLPGARTRLLGAPTPLRRTQYYHPGLRSAASGHS